MKQLPHPNHTDAISLLPSDYAKQICRDKFEGDRLQYPESLPRVNAYIQKAINNLGQYEQAAKTDVLNFLAEQTITLITKDFKNLTEPELEKALLNGSLGNYGIQKNILHTVNLENTNFWIRKFLEDENRNNAISYYNLLLTQPKQKKELSEAESLEVVRKGCINAYRDFLCDGSMPKYGAVYYKYLKPRISISWDERESEEIKLVAKQISAGNETNYKTECKNVALKKWFEKIKPNTNYDQFKSLLEPFKPTNK